MFMVISMALWPTISLTTRGRMPSARSSETQAPLRPRPERVSVGCLESGSKPSMAGHLTFEELQEGLGGIMLSPQDRGTLKAIVIRPEVETRVSLRQCELSPDGGVHGDNWAKGCWMSLPDGRPHPDVQVAIMNARAIALIAQEEARWPLAGNQLLIDLDLSRDNLPPGTRVSVGPALLEINAVPHNGCKKFAERFGVDATRFVNSKEGVRLHLRGIYARIVEPGVVTVGDPVTKL
jgi:MOSC domain